MWDEILRDETAGVTSLSKMLDVCCGTGRWAPAFSAPRAWLSSISATSLLTSSKSGCLCSVCVDNARALPVMEGTYDLVVNMHGLYGLPAGDPLRESIASMFAGPIRFCLPKGVVVAGDVISNAH